ncbi:ABC transporter permease, partial [Ellagibacter isourolithinifaciens]|uniref:ABC transporter permease n=1 Tax=Ellagibacter isourolithinifaciens TaxID=2137581 RepID=UPI0023EFC818
GRAELEAQRAAAEEQFADAEAQLDAAQASYDAAMAQRAMLAEQLAQAQAAGAYDVVAQLEAAIAQIDAQTAGVPEQIAQGRAQLAEQRSQAQASMDAAEGELASSQATIDSGRAQLESGRRQLASGRSEYEDGLAQYEEGANELSAQRADAEEQFADAEAKLADAQADVDAIADTEGEVYVLDLTKNIGTESFKSDAGRIDQIAQVFPFLFFLVAALVSLTTMTRMVEEERVLIGTFKALGYSKARITSKYLIYAIVASGVGAIIGIVALSKFLPWFIMGAYAIIYAVPCRPCPIDPAMTAAAAAGLGVGITVIATWFAAASTLRERPAFLMLPRAPKAGKRILLERIRPVWRRLSFSWKVTSRNLFRYKRRFIMAIVGIAGCTALLLTGLGLQNAINDIIDKQYGELYHYNTIVRMASDSTDDEKSQVEQRVEEDASGEYAWLATANKQAQSISDDEGADVSQHRIDIIVPEHPDTFSNFITMRTREGHEELALSDDGVLVSEKLAMELSLTVGSTFSIFDEDAVGDATGDGREVTVAGIMENYVGHYVYFTPTLYEQVMGEEPVFTTLYANEVEDEGAREVLSDELLATDGVKTVTYNDETIDSYRTMLKSVDSVVVVLVIAAALLAFVVLYNLTNINITERVREIATLKVLGFTPREVDAYIYRETLLLAVIGALVGLLLGIVMEGFVVVTAEVDQVMFGRDIHAASFIIAFLLTMVFSVIVTLAMRPKLRRIDMVESLKSNE